MINGAENSEPLKFNLFSPETNAAELLKGYTDINQPLSSSADFRAGATMFTFVYNRYVRENVNGHNVPYNILTVGTGGINAGEFIFYGPVDFTRQFPWTPPKTLQPYLKTPAKLSICDWGFGGTIEEAAGNALYLLPEFRNGAGKYVNIASALVQTGVALSMNMSRGQDTPENAMKHEFITVWTNPAARVLLTRNGFYYPGKEADSTSGRFILPKPMNIIVGTT